MTLENNMRILVNNSGKPRDELCPPPPQTRVFQKRRRVCLQIQNTDFLGCSFIFIQCNTAAPVPWRAPGPGSALVLLFKQMLAETTFPFMFQHRIHNFCFFPFSASGTLPVAAAAVVDAVATQRHSRRLSHNERHGRSLDGSRTSPNFCQLSHRPGIVYYYFIIGVPIIVSRRTVS